jgi:hypothetical protein
VYDDYTRLATGTRYWSQAEDTDLTDPGKSLLVHARRMGWMKVMVGGGEGGTVTGFCMTQLPLVSAAGPWTMMM